MALRRFRADLHIHSCLSPCGELSIYPRKIVERALEEGLEIIAVTDHNTAENAAAVLRAAEGTGLTVFPGMELTSEEEVHVLGLFETMEEVLRVQDEVFRKLPETEANAPFIKDQVIVNEGDEVTGFSRRFLIAATTMNVFEVVELIHRNGGLAIASHVDRESFSLFSQLGFIPPGLALDALEVSSWRSRERARQVIIADDSLPLVRFSDAHRPEEIGRAWTEFRMAAKTWDELRLAIKGSGGRTVCRS
ncbi:MAG: PHP domain-containing protein [Candidatus Aminicenantes bacterium]|nr:PHP domain-containing protein [Candidatus Aminicenantes bacterium]